MSIREFSQALRTTQGQHILASVLEGPEQGQRLYSVRVCRSGPRSLRVCWPGISRHWPGAEPAAS